MKKIKIISCRKHNQIKCTLIRGLKVRTVEETLLVRSCGLNPSHKSKRCEDK